MNTVSAVAKLIPRPPARVDSKKQNVCAPTAKQITTWLKAEFIHSFNIRILVYFYILL